MPGCIAFSNEHFYHGRLLPRRLPPRSRRLEPALVDILVPGGAKKGKVNPAEASALVDYLVAQLARSPSELEGLSVGIISLAGVEQARLLRSLLLGRLTDAQLAHHRLVVGDATSFQGDERDVILLSMVASKGAAPPQLGRTYEQRYNVALSRARDRMVLFRSLRASDVPNPDDLKQWTIQRFAAAAAGQPAAASLRLSSQVEGRSALSGGGGSGGSGTADGTADGELHAWLHARGFAFTTDCAVAGSAAVVEDEQHDRRLCVCLDGGAAASLAEWSESIKEGRALASAGWAFHRIWRSSWLVHRARCEADLASALEAAGIRPSVSAPSGGGGTRPKQPPHHLEDALSGGAGAASSSAAGGTSGLSGRKRKGGSAVAAAAAEEEEEEEVEEEGGRAEAEPAATKQAGAKKRR